MKTEDREYDCAQLFHADELFLRNASTVAFGKTPSLGNKKKKQFWKTCKNPRRRFWLDRSGSVIFVLHH